MRLIGWILKQIYEKMLLAGRAKRRIDYLRRQGIRIGENCIINPMKFSTEPYLIEIGNLVRISGGAKFITHDGSVYCFQDEPGSDLSGKIKKELPINIVNGLWR